MSTHSFENKKSFPVRVLSFHFAVGKMKTAIDKNLVQDMNTQLQECIRQSKPEVTLSRAVECDEV